MTTTTVGDSVFLADRYHTAYHCDRPMLAVEALLKRPGRWLGGWVGKQVSVWVGNYSIAQVSLLRLVARRCMKPTADSHRSYGSSGSALVIT